MKYPLFGIIYNWKGLKEENYLYTARDLKKFDKELYDNCMENPHEWHDSTLCECAWKTWMGFRLDDEFALERFLTGDYNEDLETEIDGWYWENVEDNDLYGLASDTMKRALADMRSDIIRTDVLLYDNGSEYDLGRADKKTVFLRILSRDEAVDAFQKGKRVYFIYENNRIYHTNCRKVCRDLDYLKDHYDFYHEFCGVVVRNREC